MFGTNKKGHIQNRCPLPLGGCVRHQRERTDTFSHPRSLCRAINKYGTRDALCSPLNSTQKSSSVWVRTLTQCCDHHQQQQQQFERSFFVHSVVVVVVFHPRARMFSFIHTQQPKFPFFVHPPYHILGQVTAAAFCCFVQLLFVSSPRAARSAHIPYILFDYTMVVLLLMLSADSAGGA
ncbi:hypothetical protein GPALN_014631 [Globodera pallida]|nr:hypothetical protein GPALN_014631 [Globodera pallida]